jgi:hypothetical protein
MGIRFEGELSDPIVKNISQNPAQDYFVIENTPIKDFSARKSITVRFDPPIYRLGLRPENGSKTTLASIRVYSDEGDFLAEFLQGSLKSRPGPLVGMEARGEDLIDTVVVDYLYDETPEQISEILVEYPSTRPFQTCVPQIAAGPAGMIRFQTLIQIQNLLNQRNEIFFHSYDHSGNPLQLEFDGEVTAVKELTIQDKKAVQLRASGVNGELSVGYACVESRIPVNAQAVFQIFDTSDKLISESGIKAVKADSRQQAFVAWDETNAVDTGIAIANPGQKETRIELLLNGESINSKKVKLDFTSGEQRAFFLSEIFDLAEFTNLVGTLEINSEESVVVTTIRTINGLAVSSLPGGNIGD